MSKKRSVAWSPVLTACLLPILAACGGSSPSRPYTPAPARFLSIEVSTQWVEFTLDDNYTYGLGLITQCYNGSTTSCIQPFLPAPGAAPHECFMGPGDASCSSAGGEVSLDQEGNYRVHLTRGADEFTMTGRFDQSSRLLTWQIVITGTCPCSDSGSIVALLR